MRIRVPERGGATSVVMCGIPARRYMYLVLVIVSKLVQRLMSSVYSPMRLVDGVGDDSEVHPFCHPLGAAYTKEYRRSPYESDRKGIIVIADE
jgi:hypothetical protein